MTMTLLISATELFTNCIYHSLICKAGHFLSAKVCVDVSLAGIASEPIAVIYVKDVVCSRTETTLYREPVLLRMDLHESH